MVFKKMLTALGVGGPSVDTVLTNANIQPGGILQGNVNLTGGQSSVDIEHVTLSLITRVEYEHANDRTGTMEFHRIGVSGPFHLATGARYSIPFQFPIPWETPITHVYGQYLHGMTMGVRTELAVAKAVDKGDLDPIAVHPLPIQEAILDGVARLGFQFKKADLEAGHIRGSQQTLPFYQEIEFFPAPAYAHAMNELELTFLTNPHGVDVIVEVDKRGGLFGGGHDTYFRFQAPHTDTGTDWAAQIDAWLRNTVLTRAPMVGGYPPHAAPHAAYGHPHHMHGRRGSGAGGVVAGMAAGMLGGLVVGEMLDDAFGDDGGDFGDFGGE